LTTNNLTTQQLPPPPSRPMEPPSRKKISYPVRAPLMEYLREEARVVELAVDYATLRAFREAYPLYDGRGNYTNWMTVSYHPADMASINEGLRQMYVRLKVGGDTETMQHLVVSRIDFCEFGNYQPFRVRIVNVYNDNQDYFYVKRADASRVYGLELEHLLSPNRMHFFVWGDTLVEEHVLGIPGDIFIGRHLRDPGFKEVRIAKEFVKFNERCFLRLLGDMRACNFVVDVTPDFEEVQYRIRAMDFDQQCYDGRKSFYFPKYFKENNPLVHFGIRWMDVRSARQYQLEERALIALRMRVSRARLARLLDVMVEDEIAPEAKVHQLRSELAAFHRHAAYLECETMGEILKTNLDLLREENQERDRHGTLPRDPSPFA